MFIAYLADIFRSYLILINLHQGLLESYKVEICKKLVHINRTQKISSFHPKDSAEFLYRKSRPPAPQGFSQELNSTCSIFF